MAIGNSGDVALAESAARLLADPAPVVRGAAVWALARLDAKRALALRCDDDDPDVSAEWDAVRG